MLSVLTRAKFEELFNYAHSLKLDVLTEVDDKDDAMYAISKKIEIVGINNRNLRTLEVNLDNARELYKLFPSSISFLKWHLTIFRPYVFLFHVL